MDLGGNFVILAVSKLEFPSTRYYLSNDQHYLNFDLNKLFSNVSVNFCWVFELSIEVLKTPKHNENSDALGHK